MWLSFKAVAAVTGKNKTAKKNSISCKNQQEWWDIKHKLIQANVTSAAT